MRLSSTHAESVPAYVGDGEQRRAFAFFIEHEACSHSNEIRIILMFDVWNPALSPEQRELVASLVSGEAAYYAGA